MTGKVIRETMKNSQLGIAGCLWLFFFVYYWIAV
jgi:hypothetical protein